MNSKPSPKSQVALKFAELFGEHHDVVVRGVRVTRQNGIPVKDCMTQLIVGGEMVAWASAADWRKSYRLLEINIENLYKTGLALV
jgi:hypothetical protein